MAFEAQRTEPKPPRLASTRADGASNNKHAPRIRKRDQRRARILRWASSRFVELDPDSDVDVGAASLGMANAAVRAAAQARDPIALASKRAAAIATAIAGTASSTVGAALAAALAPYQAPATATAVTCRGTATSTVGAALAAALAPYHVRECNAYYLMYLACSGLTAGSGLGQGGALVYRNRTCPPRGRTTGPDEAVQGVA